MTNTSNRKRTLTAGLLVGLVALALLGAGLAPAAAQTGDQTIQGTVSDVDTGNPVANADVAVYDDSGDQVGSDTTGEDGSYSVENLADGEYTVEVAADGYDAQNHTITIEGSDRTLDVDLGTTPTYQFTLPSGGVYAVGIPGPLEHDRVGDVFGPFQGVIYTYDADTDSWERVGLEHQIEPLDAYLVVVDENASDVTAEVTFAGQAGVNESDPAQVTLQNGWNFVAAPESDVDAAFDDDSNVQEVYNPASFAEASSDDVEGEDNFDRYDTSNSDSPRVNPFKGYFVKTDAEGTVETRAYEGITRVAANDALGLGTGTVSGVVTNTSGDPVDGATVELDTGDQTTTNSNGEYTFEDVEAGARTVTADQTGYTAFTKSVAVPVGETSQVDFTLTESGSINGTVTNSAGEPIMDAQVIAETGDNTFLTTTDSNGDYEFSDVPGEREYTVTANTSDHEVESQTVNVSEDQNVTNVDFSLVELGSISGTVASSSDGPIANATVTAVHETDGIELQVTTDADGAYTIEKVPANRTYDVTADAEDYHSKTHQVSVSAGEDVQNEDFSLDAFDGAISGTVVDADSGEALSGVDITAESNDGSVTQTATTDENGSYSITLDGDREYTVTAEVEDYETGEQSIYVDPGESVQGVDFSLSPLGYVYGTVFDNDGDGLSNAEVTLVQNGTEVTTAETDADGDYETKKVPIGTYDIRASASGYTPEVIEAADVDRGGTLKYFSLPENGSISGTITDAELENNDTIAGATVTVEAEDRDFRETVETDDSGQYTVTDVYAETSYVVVANNSDHFENSTTLTVDDGEDATGVDLALDPRPATIRGTIEDNVSEEPIPNVTVTVTDTDDLELLFEESDQTDANGSYAIEVPAHSEYEISVEADDHENPNARTVEVGAGEEYKEGSQTVDYSLTPLDSTISGNVTDAKLDSSLLGSDAIENATVNITRVDGDFNATAETDSNGEYSVDNVPAHGTYEVTASAEDYRSVSIGDLTVEPNDDIELSFELTPKNGSISGILTDSETGEGITDATVKALSNETTLSTTTIKGKDDGPEDDGEFTFEEVPAHETYTVYAEHKDYELNLDDEDHREEFTIGPNETVADVSIELDPKPATVSGTVTDAVSGNGIGGVTVTVVENGTLDQEVGSATTSDDGSYAIDGVPADGTNYTVEFSGPDHEDEAVGIGSVDANAEVNVSPSLDPLNGTLSGNVTDAKLDSGLAESDAIENATVTLEEVGGDYNDSVETDSNGEYTFGEVKSSRDYTITVSKNSTHKTATREIFVEPGENREENFALEPKNGSISGTIVNTSDTDNVVAHANVTVERLDSDGNVEETVAELTAADNGTYSVTDLSPYETYRVTADNASYLANATSVDVGAGENVSGVDVQLEPAGYLTGSVFDQNGNPVANATVTVYESGTLTNETITETTTNSDGTFETEEIATGDYYVEVTADGYEKDSDTVTFAQGENTAVFELTEA